jgi:hypothetical protein
MMSPIHPVAQALLIVGVLYISYIYIRPVLERFADLSISPAEETKDLLVSDDELPTLAPTVREELMRIDPKFVETLMGIEKDTIEIMGSVVTTVAGLLASAAEDTNIDAYRQDAILYVSKETGGTPPKFCTKDRMDRAFDGDSTKGLAKLHNCLPARPAKYLLLLSYAAKVYMKQLREARETLGGAYSGSGALQGGPEMEMPSFAAPRNDDGSARLPPDGFRGAIEGFVDGTPSLNYSSSYLLPTPTRLTASEATEQQPLKTSFENAVDAWKAAYDTDSLRQIRAYIRYCKWARKEIAAVRRDAESGAVANKIQLPPTISPSASALSLPL